MSDSRAAGPGDRSAGDGNFVDRWLFASMPAERLAMVRLLVGLYAVIHIAIRTPHYMSFRSMEPIFFRPIGVVWLTLDAPLPAWIVVAIPLATLAAGVAFTLGWRWRVSAPVFALLLLWQLTYVNCWGQIIHTTNLLVLYVGLLAVAPAADTLSLDARARRLEVDTDRRAAAGHYAWALRLMALACVVAYVLAGVAKMKQSGWAYWGGDTLRNHIAFDNVRKLELGSWHSPFGAWLVPYPAFFAVLGVVTMILELGAPLALLGRRIGVVWVIAMWSFHLGVLLLMLILFAFQLSFVAFLPFLRPERLLRFRVGARLERLFARAPASDDAPDDAPDVDAHAGTSPRTRAAAVDAYVDASGG